MEDVQEKHGIQQDVNSVVLNERPGCISIATNDQYAGRTVFLSPAEARHIAAKLYRIAKRVESRL